MGMWLKGLFVRLEMMGAGITEVRPDDPAGAHGIIRELIEARLSKPFPFTRVENIHLDDGLSEWPEGTGPPSYEYRIVAELRLPTHYTRLPSEDLERLKIIIRCLVRRTLREIFPHVAVEKVEIFYALWEV